MNQVSTTNSTLPLNVVPPRLLTSETSEVLGAGLFYLVMPQLEVHKNLTRQFSEETKGKSAATTLLGVANFDNFKDFLE